MGKGIYISDKQKNKVIFTIIGLYIIVFLKGILLGYFTKGLRGRKK